MEPKTVEAELAQHANLQLILEPAHALALLGTLQLALRHPRFSGPAKDIMQTLALWIQSYLFDAGPNTAELCEKGWSTDNDPV